MERQFRRAVRTTIVSRLVVLALFVLSIVILTRWSIARPIRALIAAARAVGRGDLSQRIPVPRQDEIGELAAEFNRMAENLQAAHDELIRQAEERLRLEQEVQQAQKLATVGMLAAEVAHEIGTPLNVISGRAEVLDRAVPRDHPERRNLDVILSQADRIKGIIRALLDYTRPRRPTLRPEPILPLVGRVASILMDRSQRRGVRLQIELPIGLPPVMADPEHLQQVFLNLVLNALDATREGGTVRITSGSDPTLAARRARQHPAGQGGRVDAGRSRDRHRQGADRRGAEPRLRAVLLHQDRGHGHAVWACRSPRRSCGRIGARSRC